MPVGIVGGGWAGLAAAITLADAGIPVTLFERASTLGGRARRVEWQGHILDNGQHILLGAYHQTLALMRLLDVESRLIRLPLEWTIKSELRLRCPRLSAPWHLLVGLMSARGLGHRDKLAALGLMRRVRVGLHISSKTVAEFLREHRQTPRLIRLVWEPLCLAALNTPAQIASATIFCKVLRDTLLGERIDSDLCLPGANLGALFPDAAADFVRFRGGEISTGWAVSGIRREQDAYVVSGKDGELRCSQLICAIGPWQLSSLLSHFPEMSEFLKKTEAYQWQPICTVYMGFAETVRLPRPMLGLMGGLAQWVFDRGHTHSESGVLAAVISASGILRGVSSEAIARQVTGELSSAFGLPAPVWHKTIMEKYATLSCVPGLFRPEQRTVLPNFYLAGDYTDSPYPATLESAVTSGVKCAQLILSKS
jgi:hydroxysqualene dehydroxylase